MLVLYMTSPYSFVFSITYFYTELFILIPRKAVAIFILHLGVFTCVSVTFLKL